MNKCQECFCKRRFPDAPGRPQGGKGYGFPWQPQNLFFTLSSPIQRCNWHPLVPHVLWKPLKRCVRRSFRRRPRQHPVARRRSQSNDRSIITVFSNRELNRVQCVGTIQLAGSDRCRVARRNHEFRHARLPLRMPNHFLRSLAPTKDTENEMRISSNLSVTSVLLALAWIVAMERRATYIRGVL